MSTITKSGMNQGALYDLLNDIKNLINELRADHATFKTVVDEIKTNLNGTLSKLDADAGVSDTDYASTYTVSSSTPATLTYNTDISFTGLSDN